jgi:DNA-directed RNA polymerase subunit RPC12/RpoP
MIVQAVQCNTCSWLLPPELWNKDDGQNCPGCGTHMLVRVFPAIARAKLDGTPENLADPTESSCFYHHQNRAVKPCDECGRFLCSLCELETPAGTLCPVCFNANVRGRKIENLESSRTMHDSVALGLATLPALMVWPVVFTAPLALYWTIRHWNAPRSVAPRTRIRFYLAALIALGEIGLIVMMIVAIAMARKVVRR